MILVFANIKFVFSCKLLLVQSLQYKIIIKCKDFISGQNLATKHAK